MARPQLRAPHSKHHPQGKIIIYHSAIDRSLKQTRKLPQRIDAIGSRQSGLRNFNCNMRQTEFEDNLGYGDRILTRLQYSPNAGAEGVLVGVVGALDPIHKATAFPASSLRGLPLG